LKALIIGAAGFVGKHLITHLKEEKGYAVYATKLAHEDMKAETDGVFDLNILNKEEIKEVLKLVQPDCILHLAAQSSVALSWQNPTLTVDINIKGSVNVLDAVRELEMNPRILLIGSGEEYGRILPDETPIKETNCLRLGNIYAATKAAQNMIGKIYADAYGMDIILIRAFNHIGPGQAPLFVVSDFCKQAAEIKKGMREAVFKVGNLSARRDFTDVRDVVRAYGLLMEKGRSGETYNIGSGKALEIDKILQRIIALSEINADVVVEKERLRPIDIPIIEANIEKLEKDTGWKRMYDLDTTLKETISFWLENI